MIYCEFFLCEYKCHIVRRKAGENAQSKISAVLKITATSTLCIMTISSALITKASSRGSARLQPAQLENCTLYERDSCHVPSFT